MAWATLLFTMAYLAPAAGLGGSADRGDRPPPRVAVAPAADAPALTADLGGLDAVDLRYWVHGPGNAVESWGVRLDAGPQLARVGRMRRSDYAGAVAFTQAYDVTVRAGGAAYTGRMGRLKVAPGGYGLYLTASDGSPRLFVEADAGAARDVAAAVRSEAARQRPAPTTRPAGR